jgi:hypothetical protein
MARRALASVFILDGPAPLGTLPRMHDPLGIAREVLAPSPDRGEQAMQTSIK